MIVVAFHRIVVDVKAVVDSTVTTTIFTAKIIYLDNDDYSLITAAVEVIVVVVKMIFNNYLFDRRRSLESDDCLL